MAKRTTHANTQQLTITPQHAKGNEAKSMLVSIHALLARFQDVTEQLKSKSVWQLICEQIMATVAHFKPGQRLGLPPPTPAVLTGNCCF